MDILTISWIVRLKIFTSNKNSKMYNLKTTQNIVSKTTKNCLNHKEGTIMGLFNRNKKEKKTKWFINKTPGDVHLEDNYIRININLPKTENIVFYKDIQDIKKVKNLLK